MSKDSRGFATLGVTLLMLVILSGVALFTGKVLLTEQRITNNEVQYAMSFSKAEAGLALGARHLIAHYQDICPDGSNSKNSEKKFKLPPDEAERVDVQWQCEANSVVLIRSEFIDASGKSRGRVSEAYQVSGGLFPYGAPAPLTAAYVEVEDDGDQCSKEEKDDDDRRDDDNDDDGNDSDDDKNDCDDETSHIVANPNNGNPISVVTKEIEFDDEDEGKDNNGLVTCTHDNTDINGWCHSDNIDDTDIVESPSAFPADLVEYVFGDASIDFIDAGFKKINDCENTNFENGSLFLFRSDDDCKIEDRVIGSKESPVFLVVKGEKLELEDVEFYGVILFLGTDKDEDEAVEIEESEIFGAMLSNSGVELEESLISWDLDIFSNLADISISDSLSRIPGSWRDFYADDEIEKE